MTTVTEGDLKELKDLLINLDRKVDNLRDDINDVKIALGKLETKVDGLEKRIESGLAEVNKRIDDTNKRIDGGLADVNKRIDDTNKQIDKLDVRLNSFLIGFLSIVGILVTGILGLAAKVVFFPRA